MDQDKNKSKSWKRHARGVLDPAAFMAFEANVEKKTRGDYVKKAVTAALIRDGFLIKRKVATFVPKDV